MSDPSSQKPIVEPSENISLLLLFWIFFKIGSTAFGGFMALISVVQNYVVDRKQWLTHTDMLNGISLATILPGPVAVNVVAYVGYHIKGIKGALVCILAVMLPSFFLILGLSHFYFSYGDLPMVNKFFQGFLPAVAAIIVTASWNMGKKSIKSPVDWGIAVVAVLVLIGVGGFFSTLGVIVVAGIVGFMVFRKTPDVAQDTLSSPVGSPLSLQGVALSIASAGALLVMPLLSAQSVLIWKLLFNFAGMSLLLFGGGFVFIPMMQEVIVETYGWVSQQEFIDGIALGQVTPGPILISATFVGYKVAGVAGAIAATVGIFLPPAMLMLVCSHYLERIKNSDNVQAILRGIRSGVIGMIAAAAYVVLFSAQMHWGTGLIFLSALWALLKFKIEVVWIIPISGMVGFLLYP
jgi:chromate transporter